MGRRNLPEQEEAAPVERPQKQPGKKKMLNSGESNVVSGVSVSWFNVLNEAEDSRDDEKEDEFTDAVETRNLNVSMSIVAIDPSAVESKGSKEVTESSKTKKKNKKRGGRTANKDDDLEKLLAELGEGPPISKPVQVPDSTPSQKDTTGPQDQLIALNEATDDDKIEDEGAVESAAAKKRKKEKEKEKKTVTAAMAEAREERHEEPKIETKSKGTEKKLPRHVREKQEVLMRRKVAEERKKKKKRGGEDKGGRGQEELERQAEEAKRKKKEWEKEKLRKKKEEGMLLTRRQKDQQHRLEAIRNQLLASKGVSVSAGEDGPSPKRPVYTSKKNHIKLMQMMLPCWMLILEIVKEKDPKWSLLLTLNLWK